MEQFAYYTLCKLIDREGRDIPQGSLPTGVEIPVKLTCIRQTIEPTGAIKETHVYVVLSS